MITILYVDDEEDLLDIAKLYLEEEGNFHVDMTTSARSALALLGNNHYDAIISDYQMPGMDGIGLLKEIRTHYGDLPFILFTGKGREEIVIDAINNGADFYLQKGGDPKAQFAELIHHLKMAVSRNQARETSKRSELRIRAILDNMPVGLVAADIETHRFIFANNAFSRLLGLPIEEIIGKSPEDIHPVEVLPIVAVEFGKALRGEPVYSEGIPVLRKDGTQFIADITATRMELDGRLCSLGAFRDVTEQRRAARAIMESEEKYKQLFNNMPSAAVIYEPIDGGKDFVFRDVNPAAESIDGVKKSEILDRAVTEIFPGVIEFGLFDVLKRVNTTGKTEYLPATQYRDERMGAAWRENWVYKSARNQVVAIYHDISEQKNAEMAIKASEEKYRSLFESMSTGVFYQMADGSLVDINPAALRMFGLSYEQFTGRDSYDPLWKVIREDGTTVPPEEHPSIVTLRTGKPIRDSILGVYNPERQNFTWLSLNTEPQFRPGETRPYRVYVTMNDITERKHADDALRESQEQYQQVVEHAGEAIVIAQGEKLVFANPKILRMLDVSHDELIKHPFTDFIHPDDRALVFERYRQRIQGETIPDQYEFRLIRTTGKIIWVYISAVKITWKGNPATLNLLTDISQLKQREEEIFLKNTLLSTVQESSTDGILLVNENGKVLQYNRNFVRLWNIPDELLQSGEDEPMLQYAMGQVSNPEEFLARVRYLYDHRDEKYADEIELKDGRVLERTSAPIIGHLGKYYGRVWYFHDISNRKKIEESFKKANRQLSLLGSITRHDINNKLTVIIGYLNIARKRGQNAQMLEFIDKIETATNMIRSQIEFTKLYKDLGAKEPQWQNVDSVLPYSHVPSGIHFISEVSGEIFADMMLEKVFFNLLDNSIRHGEYVTEIRVTAKIDIDSLKILWEDNGVGIPTEDKEKIFERGYGKNTGLGMFLVREILALTDITITETGDPGKGARFEIVVPKGMYRIKS